MYEDSCQNEPYFPWLLAPPALWPEAFPLQPGTAFLLPPRATFQPSQVAQRPRVAWGSAEHLRRRPTAPVAQRLCMQIN